MRAFIRVWFQGVVGWFPLRLVFYTVVSLNLCGWLVFFVQLDSDKETFRNIQLEPVP